MIFLYLILTYMFFAVFNSEILVPLLFKYLPKEFTENYIQKDIVLGAFILSFFFEFAMVIGGLRSLFMFIWKVFKKTP